MGRILDVLREKGINEESYIYKKEIDWSVLHLGINIPVSIQVVFQQKIDRFLSKGESKNINLLLHDKTFRVKLINQNFDAKKYPTHKEFLQIRYSPQSNIAKELREIFHVSYDYLKIAKGELNNRKQQLRVPEKLREYLALYTTHVNDTFFVDSITNADAKIIRSDIADFNEEELEFSIDYNRTDLTARIENKQLMVKIRKLDKAIGENLKLLYDYQCQLCGFNFAEKYRTNIVESHHIEFFVNSLNNNSDNIVIICPNHHRVIHKTKPLFEKSKLAFMYPNGLKENIKLNKHL